MAFADYKHFVPNGTSDAARGTSASSASGSFARLERAAGETASARLEARDVYSSREQRYWFLEGW